MVASTAFSKPVREIGEFLVLAWDTFVQLFTARFAWREFLVMSWFVARVSAGPAIMLTIPFNVLVQFVFEVLLFEIGAPDLSGTGAALAVLTQTGPATTVLTIGGAGATAMCADLGARTIREEIDAMTVMGINPIQRLVVPRVAALTLNGFLLNGIVTMFGFIGTYVFAIYVMNVTPGAFAGSLTLLTSVADPIIASAKATLFGLTAGLVACYKGLTVDGGAQGVGNAVNETVVYTFMALLAINSLLTAVLQPFVMP
ncbi:MAG: ABC transporter permease [Mycobacterium sp.]|uniref:MlaE family ABC transporter permease n=1 Tax=Mycobacterium sp. TaxID=1785 RepID=UPI001ECDA302|nr:ABC transporter permease [Mycobacterium sp.]MBW0017981.1 ABC transporter permease [Mycobacterium sp.]